MVHYPSKTRLRVELFSWRIKACDVCKVSGSEWQEKIKDSWIVTPRSLGDRYKRFGETNFPYIQDRMVFLPTCMVDK